MMRITFCRPTKMLSFSVKQIIEMILDACRVVAAGTGLRAAFSRRSQGQTSSFQGQD